MKKLHFLWFVVVFMLYGTSGTNYPTEMQFRNYEELHVFLQQHHYNVLTWPQLDTVPRVYIKAIPHRWAQVSKTFPTSEKKKIFFAIVEPLILHANEELREVRQRILQLQQQPALSNEEKNYLFELQSHYRIPSSNSIDFEELLMRVDVVAPSLALAQAAVESGWATSKFASQGNALYGQWAWGEGAMTPSQQRSGLGNYGIKSFDTPLESVNGYMFNLNSHGAYAAFRNIRAQQRKKGQMDGSELANGLLKYSENGESYVRSLQSVIRVNHLHETDNDHLTEMPPILLMPVDDIAKK